MVNGLPEKLKNLRKQYGLSQKEIAKRLNVSPSIVSGYETGERTPSLDVLISLSYLFNCSTDYLLGRDSNTPKRVIDASALTDRQIQAINELIKSIE